MHDKYKKVIISSFKITKKIFKTILNFYKKNYKILCKRSQLFIYKKIIRLFVIYICMYITISNHNLC